MIGLMLKNSCQKAKKDSGDVFKLSCMGSYWQRSKAFIESSSTKITHWMPLIYPE
ncbi:DUF551 domain-containing protein [Salmonella enterica]|uniref:DUF551 domain-containing protein n=1 Tax=Salmonella enterica TaxID=28901 RepID=UPI0032C3ED06